MAKIFFTVWCLVGMGGVLLYHFIRTRQLRRHLSMQLFLLQNGPAGFVYIQKNHVLVNKTFCLMIGGKRPSRVENFLELFPLPAQNLLTGWCNQLRQTKKPFEETLSLEKRTFCVRGQFIAKDSLILWWQDLTNIQKKVEKEIQKNNVLSQQKELLEHAWEALPFPAFIRGARDKSLFANAAVGQDAKTLNALHWISRPFSMQDSTYNLTYGQEAHTEEEVQALIREVARAHQRLCQELPCAVCLFSSSGHLISCSKAFAEMWHLDEEWIKDKPSYEDFWDAVQEKGLMNRVMDFAQYKKQQRGQFASLSESFYIYQMAVLSGG